MTTHETRWTILITFLLQVTKCMQINFKNRRGGFRLRGPNPPKKTPLHPIISHLSLKLFNQRRSHFLGWWTCRAEPNIKNCQKAAETNAESKLQIRQFVTGICCSLFAFCVLRCHFGDFCNFCCVRL